MQHFEAVATLVVVVAAAGVVLGPASGAGVDHQPQVSESTDANLTVTVAPGDQLGALRAATTADEVANVTRTGRQGTTFSDALVLTVTAPGLADALADQSAGTTTEQWQALLAEGDASFRGVELTADESGPPAALNLTDPEAVSALAAEGDTVWVVVDPASLSATRDYNDNGLADDADPARIRTGQTYRLTFAYAGETASDQLSFYPRVAEVETRPGQAEPVFYPAPNQTLSARSTLAPGTVVTVELAGTGPESFRRQRRVRLATAVQSRIEAVFDLRGVPDGTPVTVSVRDDGELIDVTEGRIPELTASLSAPARIEPGEPLAVDRASLSEGGFLVVHDGGPGGPVVAVRSLEPGATNDLTIDLEDSIVSERLWIAPYLDADRDGTLEVDGPDRPYRRDGATIATVVTVASDEETQTEPSTTAATERTTTESTTVPTTATTAEAQVAEDPATATERRVTTYTLTAVDGPGFGIGTSLVAVAVVGGTLIGRCRAA